MFLTKLGTSKELSQLHWTFSVVGKNRNGRRGREGPVSYFKSYFNLALVVITQLTFSYSKSVVETLEKAKKYGRRFGVFIVEFEHISRFSAVSVLLTLHKC